MTYSHYSIGFLLLLLSPLFLDAGNQAVAQYNRITDGVQATKIPTATHISIHKRRENTAHPFYLQIKSTCMGAAIGKNVALTSSRCINGTATQYYVTSGASLVENNKFFFVVDIRRHSTSDLAVVFIEGNFPTKTIILLRDTPLASALDFIFFGFGDLGHDDFTETVRMGGAVKSDGLCQQLKIPIKKNLQCFKATQTHNPCQADLGAVLLDDERRPIAVISYVVDKCDGGGTFPFLVTTFDAESLEWTKGMAETRRKGSNEGEGPSLFFSPFLLVVLTVVQFFFF